MLQKPATAGNERHETRAKIISVSFCCCDVNSWIGRVKSNLKIIKKFSLVSRYLSRERFLGGNSTKWQKSDIKPQAGIIIQSSELATTMFVERHHRRWWRRVERREAKKFSLRNKDSLQQKLHNDHFIALLPLLLHSPLSSLSCCSNPKTLIYPPNGVSSGDRAERTLLQIPSNLLEFIARHE